jgi:mutator protein MutT
MKQVAVGLIMNDGRVLACQRRHDGSYPLKWEFPGGKLEDGESAEAALVRELAEELGIDAVVGRELHTQEWVYQQYEAGSKAGAFRVFYFLIESFAGTAVNHAFEQIRWVTPEELKDMDILEGNRGAVETLITYAREKHIPEQT